MSVAAAPLWTAEQFRWLAALELKPWMHGALPEAASDAAVAQIREEVSGARAFQPPRVAQLAPAVREFQPKPSRQAPQAPAFRDDAPAFTERTAPHRVAAPGGMPDKLHFALVRASGLNPNSAEAQAVFAAWPSSAELRANPQAKRALWPQLRALRKAARKGEA